MTDELRRLLDERGVEWIPVAWNPKRETFYHAANGVGFCADEYTDGVKIYTDATITPEQAIAATLGDVPSLPHFWTHDGTLHIELPKLPESISVRLPDQRDREVGSARVWQYMRDSGTCEVEESWHGESEMVEYHCTACDEYMAVEVVKPNGAQPPNYCPNCGRKVVDE